MLPSICPGGGTAGDFRRYYARLDAPPATWSKTIRRYYRGRHAARYRRFDALVADTQNMPCSRMSRRRLRWPPRSWLPWARSWKPSAHDYRKAYPTVGAGVPYLKTNRAGIAHYANETALRGFTHLARHSAAAKALMETLPSLPQHLRLTLQRHAEWSKLLEEGRALA